MKNLVLTSTLVMLLSICCTYKSTGQHLTKISADSLISNIEKYCNTKVELEGLIIHVCSFNGKKMKLKADSGEIIKIVPFDSNSHFDSSFYGKRVRILGVVKESRIEKSYIGKVEKEKTLLCHIDNTPCKDTAWIKRQITAGRADSLSKRDIERIRKKMERAKKDYISVVTIVAEKCEKVKDVHI